MMHPSTIGPIASDHQTVAAISQLILHESLSGKIKMFAGSSQSSLSLHLIFFLAISGRQAASNCISPSIATSSHSSSTASLISSAALAGIS
jgi:hypothetical protein